MSLGVLSLTITSQNQEFYLGNQLTVSAIEIVGFSSDGDQHLQFSFLGNHCNDCIGTHVSYPRVMIMDTKTKGVALGGPIMLTNDRITIPNRFFVNVYKSDGTIQNGTIDIKLLIQYAEII